MWNLLLNILMSVFSVLREAPTQAEKEFHEAAWTLRNPGKPLPKSQAAIERYNRMKAYESQVAERKRLKRLKKHAALKAACKANEEGMGDKEEAEEGEEDDPVPIDPQQQQESQRVEGGSPLAVISESGKDSEGFFYWIDNWHPKPGRGVSVNDIPDATPNSYFKVCKFFFPGLFCFAVILCWV